MYFGFFENAKMKNVYCFTSAVLIGSYWGSVTGFACQKRQPSFSRGRGVERLFHNQQLSNRRYCVCRRILTEMLDTKCTAANLLTFMRDFQLYPCVILVL